MQRKKRKKKKVILGLVAELICTEADFIGEEMEEMEEYGDEIQMQVRIKHIRKGINSLSIRKFNKDGQTLAENLFCIFTNLCLF